MASGNVSTVEKAIRTLKQRLVSLGDMRPGTLSVQFRNPAERRDTIQSDQLHLQGQKPLRIRKACESGSG